MGITRHQVVTVLSQETVTVCAELPENGINVESHAVTVFTV